MEINKKIIYKLNNLHRKKNNYIERSFHLIKDRNNIRWMIENDCNLVKVLKDWKPYKKSSNIIWQIFIIFLRLNLLKYIPFTNFKKIKISSDIFNFYKNKLDAISLCIYIGRETKHSHKATIFVFDKKNQKCISLIKLALKKKSRESIKKEFSVLSKLNNISNFSVPKAYYLNKSNKYFIQEYLSGESNSLELNNEHYAFQAKLKNNKKFLDFVNLKKYLLRSYKKIRLLNQSSLIKDIESALELKIWNEKINSVKIHGDFAPWNIKFYKKSKKIFVYDWEEFNSSFLPFYDLIYYKASTKNFLNKDIEKK